MSRRRMIGIMKWKSGKCCDSQDTQMSLLGPARLKAVDDTKHFEQNLQVIEEMESPLLIDFLVVTAHLSRRQRAYRRNPRAT